MRHATDALSDLPPSGKLVFTVLEHEGPLTQGEIAEQTLLPPRTVRDALSRLSAIDIVEERVLIRDARKSVYSVAEIDERSMVQ